MSNLSRTLSRRSSKAEDEESEFTSTYRSIYGGPKGLDASKWTETSSEATQSINNSGLLNESSWRTVPKQPAPPERTRSGASNLSGQGSGAFGGIYDEVTSKGSFNAADIAAANNDDQNEVNQQSDAADDTNTTTPPRPPLPPKDSAKASPSDAVWAKLEENITAAKQADAAAAEQRFYVENSPDKYSQGSIASSSVRGGSQVSAGQGAASYPGDGSVDNNATSNINNDIDQEAYNQAAAQAAHQAPMHLSTMTTSSLPEQIKAAERLLRSMKDYGDPVRQAIHANGGIAVLQTMINDKDPELQHLATSLLAELCELPEARRELASAPQAANKAVSFAVDGITKGNAPAAKLLASLAKDESELNPLFLAACAQHKAVKVLLDAATDGDNSPEIQESCMDALEAVCNADPHSGFRKLAWSGGLSKLAYELATIIIITAEKKDKWKPPLRLLVGALRKDSSLAESLCEVKIIEILSGFIANPETPMELQTGAAFILSCIASVRLRKEEITQALLDYTLPRACEVLHDVSQAITEDVKDVTEGPVLKMGVDALQRNCALICGHLGATSDLCCHVMIFHTASLKTVLMVLVQSKDFVLAKSLLAASADYASRCDNPVLA